jgi:hypothetical protein
MLSIRLLCQNSEFVLSIAEIFDETPEENSKSGFARDSKLLAMFLPNCNQPQYRG